MPAPRLVQTDSASYFWQEKCLQFTRDSTADWVSRHEFWQSYNPAHWVVNGNLSLPMIPSLRGLYVQILQGYQNTSYMAGMEAGVMNKPVGENMKARGLFSYRSDLPDYGKSTPNKALRRTAIPLRSIAAGELGR
jgi:hypothetical protein